MENVIPHVKDNSGGRDKELVFSRKRGDLLAAEQQLKAKEGEGGEFEVKSEKIKHRRFLSYQMKQNDN